MERLSEGAIDLNDNEVFNNCSYSCYVNLADTLNKLKEYEDIGLTPDEIKYFLKDFGIKVTMRNRELKKELQAKNKWIPTTEMLPKEDERVIICSQNKCISIAYYKNYFGDMEFMYFHNVTESWHIFSEVIAWQHLPEPYEQ